MIVDDLADRRTKNDEHLRLAMILTFTDVAPETGNICNFAYKFAPQRRIACTIFTKFSAFVRVYR